MAICDRLFWLFRWRSLICLPTRRGHCPLKDNVKILIVIKNFQIFMISDTFFLDITFTCLDFWSVSYKKNVYFAKNGKLKFLPVQIQWEFASGVHFSSTAGGVSGTALDHENWLTLFWFFLSGMKLTRSNDTKYDITINRLVELKSTMYRLQSRVVDWPNPS